MSSFDFDWQSADNVRFVGQCWLPETPPKTIVALVHGFGEHIGRYAAMADTFNRHGVGLIGFDLRGHGKSGGKRGHATSMEVMLEDIRQLLALTQHQFSQIPLFLYGHSMGGNLVANYVITHQPRYLRGVIMTSPWLRLAFSPPALKIWASKIVGKIYPEYTEKSRLETQGLSRNSAVGQAYLADSLVHGKITARFFNIITTGGENAIAKADQFRLPLLLMHGKADPITSLKATMEMGKKISPEWLREKYWDDCRHELHNETNRDEILALILEWIEHKR